MLDSNYVLFVFKQLHISKKSCTFAKNILMAKQEITYREATEEIEEILDKIENGEIDIDELTGQIKRAAALLQSCKDKLFQTEQEVEQVLRDTMGESVQTN